MNDWLHHVDSATVLAGQMIIYTVYCLVIISVIAWVASRITQEPGGTTPLQPAASPPPPPSPRDHRHGGRRGLSGRLTHDAGPRPVSSRAFYAWIGFLVLIGVSLHVITYNTIPWVEDDLAGTPVDAAHTFTISIADHRWDIPGGRLQVPCDELVKFSVQSLTSPDNPEEPALTYGFGIFRPDNTMVAQMQVVPGHSNDLLWTFTSAGTYSIRSTEYSGPTGFDIVAHGAIVVSDCQ